MGRSGKQQGLGGWFGLAFLLMGFVSLTSYQNATQLIESTNKTKQTYEVITNLIEVFGTMTVAESGRRGYIFLGDETDLLRSQAAIEQLEINLARIRQQLANNPGQLARLTKLTVLIDRRVSLLEQSIALYQKDQSTLATQRSLTEQSVALRYQIQTAIAELKAEEEQELRQWLAQSQTSTQSRIFIEIIATLCSYVLLITAYTLLRQQLIKQQQVETVKYELEKENELGELKLRFFSMVSHEFRTPLSIILGSAQLLAASSSAWADDRKLKNLHRIQSSAKLMTQLLTDILTLTRAEAGKLEFNPKPLDLEAFCLNLVEEIQLSSQTNHSIQFISHEHCIRVNLDERLLYSILSNLLLNAIKYSESGTTIRLILHCEPGVVIFKVEDEGIGISAEDQQTLYEPFYRGQNVNDIMGTGLGLAVVKACVDRHQGEIFVHSDVGIGTTFTIKIPQRSVASNAGVV